MRQASRTGRTPRAQLSAPRLVGAALCAAALLSSCGSSSPRSASGVSGGSEVAAQPVKSSGANPFMPTVGSDKPGIQPPTGVASSGGGPASYKADLPGLYGGTRNHTSCDAAKLVSFLEQNPDKARAWAATLGIRQSQISSYVSGLTSVLLRTDTRVTNHGYVNGVADPLQSVLEAGTAVFVDKHGAPVVKCYCGNPLTPPVLYSAPRYTGPLWTGFSTTNITIINQSTTIIKIFTLFDPNTGKTFQRTPGEGGKDGPYSGSGTSTSTPGSSTPAPAGSGAGSENPSASFSPNPVTIGDTLTLSMSGFAPGASLTIKVHRPDGGDDADRHTTAGSDGSATYSFPNAGAGEQPGTYTITVVDD